MTHFTYLLINFFTILICFIYSFHPKIKFYQHFKSFLLASICVATFFIAWDIYFTQIGIWWFNDHYTLGLEIINLPVEECLFFICIPFSCVFTYYCLTRFFNFSNLSAFNNILVFLTVIISSSIALLYADKTYTMVTAWVTVISMIYLHFIDKQNWISEASLIYLILMPGFLAVNGVLTGIGIDSPIVNYNREQFLNIRIWSIPIEDAVYGYVMILWNIYFFKKFSKLFSPKVR